jgi:hypothetical protein
MFLRPENTVMTMQQTQPRPHSAADLALAPVLIGIERNLARLRNSDDLEFELALELNDDDSFYSNSAERARRVVQGAIRNVDLHGWTVSPTPDEQGLTVSRGEYTVSLMLGLQLANYVEHGATTWP